jgi:hypothetical protein
MIEPAHQAAADEAELRRLADELFITTDLKLRAAQLRAARVLRKTTLSLRRRSGPGRVP